MATTESQNDKNEAAEGRIVGRRRVAGGSKRNDGARLSAAVGEARESITTMAADLRDRVEEHPWRALGLALGAGYIVGGGLFTALTGRLVFGGLRIGLRLAALPIVREELMSVIGTLAERGGSETERRQQ
jgi:hypothetical protein